ncbi:MAG: alpha/beta hydrolase [Hyphomicrobiales bacterium]|nr:alpha/beta hydrolase [Hyphomicrobiales bacterium]MCA1999201.1 alpha/beta hydrolase [Hyphomicrobiales bacterium]
MRRRIVAIALSMFLPLGATAAELLPELGTDAVLERPKGKPRGSIVLMAGGDGELGITGNGEITRLNGNSLIRTRRSFVAGGFATLALSSSGNPTRAIEAMKGIARPVIVVGTSRAATRMHRALSADGLVITSGMLDHFQSNVGSADALPPTLIVHHRNDTCRVTLPALVPAFQQWAGARARIVWVDGGRDEGDPCQAQGHHGFAGVEGRMVGAVLAFARGVRPR